MQPWKEREPSEKGRPWEERELSERGTVMGGEGAQ